MQALDLKDSYRASLAGHIEAIRRAQETLRTSARESEASIRRVVHRLKGSGASYGFPEISEAASRVEQTSGSGLFEAIDGLLGVLTRICAGAAPETTAVLIVEDDPVEARLIAASVASPSRQVFMAGTIAQAEKILDREEIGLVLLDLVLPDKDGRSLLLRIRENPRTATLPVFVISAGWTTQVQAECLTLGAEQFFEKPLDPEVVSAAASATIRRRSQMSKDARRDPLTGLPNRLAFRETYDRSLALAQRDKTRMSLAILDIDHFKKINDTHGHGVGDAVLQRAAHVITNNLRKSDFLARWGGEEFAAIFLRSGQTETLGALNKVLAALKSERFEVSSEKPFGITFSGGIAESWPGATVDEVMAVADRYLYLAKNAGRSRIFCAVSEVPLTTKRILLAEDDEDVAGLVMHNLGLEGFEVLHCANAEEALRSVEQSEIDLGILDVNMPGMDGFELLKELRASARFAEKPIVMLTGNGSSEDVVRGFSLGADDYITKPFSSDVLRARIQRLLR